MKRFTVYILLTLSLLLSSCSGLSGHGIGDESVFSLSTLDVIPPGTDGVGSDTSVFPDSFTVLRESTAEGGFFPAAEDTDILDKKTFERNALLFDRYGIKLNEVVKEDIASYAAAASLANESSFDMLILSAPSAASLILSESLLDLSEVRGFSFEASGYSGKLMRELSVGDSTYLATGAALLSYLRSTSAVLLNMGLAEKGGIDGEIFSLVKSGSFTYADMLGFASSVSAPDTDADLRLAVDAEPSDALSMFFSGGGLFYCIDEVTDVPVPYDFGSDDGSLYNTVISIFGEASEEAENNSVSQSKLFNISNIGELEMLRKTGAPFAALPMPKGSVRQKSYISNIDLDMAAFTALPKNGDSETAVSVMNLIYKLSDTVISELESVCAETENEISAFGLIKNSIRTDAALLFGYGGIEELMYSCAEENLSLKAFKIRAAERASAASSALAILINKTGN